MNVLKKQQEEFYVSNFLYGSHPNLQTVRSHILPNDSSLSSLGNVYCHLLLVLYFPQHLHLRLGKITQH